MIRNASYFIFVGLFVAGCSSTTGGSEPDVDFDSGTDAAPADVADVPDVPNTCNDPDRDGYGPGCELGDDCLPADPSGNPGASEQCGDRTDNDCDGTVDEGCPCTEGEVVACYTGPRDTDGVGPCHGGFQQCVDGVWTECESEVVPRGAEETLCDGVDEDCDGELDEGVTNACGLCGPLPLEICNDGLDNDCDGVIDNPDAGCSCEGRTQQPCYTGSPVTLGVGRCRGGLADCAGDSWGACLGELLPIAEVCDGLDNDCDGTADEGLRNGCGVCGAEDPIEVCDGNDNDCDGDVDEGLLLACGLCPGTAPAEVCADGLDNDCNGIVDDGCPCTGDAACYPGPPETSGVGTCRPGTRECDATGEFWTSCTEFVLPSVEICDGLDNDCDGVVDRGPDGCSVCGADAEICDGLDNDCDGFVDEGVRNTCGVCFEDVVPEFLCDGADEDCDGFVDEGLTNACGTCDESCFLAVWNDPEDWGEGEFDGVDEENTSDGLRLGSSRASFPDLWVANTDDRTVTRINTDTAEVVGTYPVGADPSRTAVDFDGNVYVANRAFGGQGSLTKIDASGCVGDDCVAFTIPIGEIGDIPRGLAVDREGFVWVGTYTGQTLYRVHPISGEIVGQFPVPVNVYGLAIDSEGIIWISTISSDGIGAFDSSTNRYLGAWGPSGCATPYGIAVDGVGNVWAGAWRCDGLIRLDRSLFDEGTVSTEMYTHPNLRETRGVAVDGDGMVYVVASGTNRVGRFDPETEEWNWTITTCDNPIGVGVATDGNIWVMCKDAAEAVRYNPDGDELEVLSTGRSPYSYSDMTGFQLRNFTAPAGTWTTTFDCGWTECSFDRINFEAAMPAGTGVEVRARTRGAEVDATWSAWTPQFSASPANIGDLLPEGRFCEVEVELTTEDREITPVVSRLEVEWQRP